MAHKSGIRKRQELQTLKYSLRRKLCFIVCNKKTETTTTQKKAEVYENIQIGSEGEMFLSSDRNLGDVF